MRSIFAITLAAVVLFGSLPLVSVAVFAPSATTRALWVWNININYDELLTYIRNPPGTNAVPYNHLFFDAGSAMTSNPAGLRAFLSKLHAAGVTAELLDGASAWVATPAAVQQNLARCDAYATFQKGSSDPSQRFDGLHLDVEPYTLPGWTQNKGSDGYSTTIQDNYMDFMTSCKQRITKNFDDNLSVDIPYWFNIVNVFKRMDSSIFDHVGVMSYRSSYEAFDATVNTLLTAANGKFPMIFGVETGDGADLAPLSYNGKGYNAVNNDIGKIADKYQTRAGFGGVAVHHYSWFKGFTAGSTPALAVPSVYSAVKAPTSPPKTTSAPAVTASSTVEPVKTTAASVTLTTTVKPQQTMDVTQSTSLASTPAPAPVQVAAPLPVVTVIAPAVTVTSTSVKTVAVTITISETVFATLNVTGTAPSAPSSSMTSSVQPSSSSASIKPSSTSSAPVLPSSSAPVSPLNQEIVVVKNGKKLPGKDSRSMWFWSAYDTLKQSGGVDEIVNFAVAPHGNPDVKIHRIYAEIDPKMLVDSTGKAIVTSFIKKAHDNGILVELLAGAPGGTWALDTGKSIPIAICSQVVAFNAANTDKFDGIHFDIEPHTLGSAIWRTGAAGTPSAFGSSSGTDRYNAAIQANYMEIMTTCKGILAKSSSPMTLAADIGSDYAYYVFALWNAINDGQVLDYLGIMNYFNTLDEFMVGNDPETKQGALYNLQRAKIPIVLGAETIGAPYAPAAITFASKGYLALESMLSDARGLLTNSTSYKSNPITNKQFFGGLAVHHYGSYAPMAAKPDSVNPSTGQPMNGSCKPSGSTLTLSDVAPNVQCVIFYADNNSKMTFIKQSTRQSDPTGFTTLPGYDSSKTYSVEYYADAACNTYVGSIAC